MMTRKKFLIPLGLIVFILLLLTGCSSKDNGSKVETKENSQLKNVETLSLSEPTLTQIEELKYATSLRELEISYLREAAADSEQDGTFHFVSNLPSLETLEITTNRASLDISGMSGSKLRELELFLENGSIVSLDPLSGLSELANLVIVTKGNLSLEPLAKCSSLETLSFSCDSTDLTPLASSTSLWRLSIGGGVEDLSGLAANRSLKQLYLGIDTSKGLEALVDVPLTYVSANNCASLKLEQLKGISTVEAIAISDEYISDITVLSSMDNIKSIHLSTVQNGIDSGTEISSADAPELDLIVSSIPVNQLQDFLSKEGTSITIWESPNR